MEAPHRTEKPSKEKVGLTAGDFSVFACDPVEPHLNNSK
jgi:hypothetical protein